VERPNASGRGEGRGEEVIRGDVSDETNRLDSFVKATQGCIRVSPSDGYLLNFYPHFESRTLVFGGN